MPESGGSVLAFMIAGTTPLTIAPVRYEGIADTFV
jgi:hypothetical protein